jgi:hypothetical protein
MRSRVLSFLSNSLRARQRGFDELHLAVLQRDLEAAQGAPRGDVAPHHAGPDHVHVLDAVRGVARKPAQPFAQEENANEIVRGRRGREFRHRTCLQFQALADVAAATPPHFDQCKRRRVVPGRSLRRGLLAHDRREDLPRGPAVAEPGQRALRERPRDRPQCQLACFVEQRIGCGQAIDQALGQRAFGGCRASGQHHRQRLGRADQARQTRGAAPARMDAELHLRQCDARFRRARGDAHSARQREFGAAAHARAVDRGDGRHRQAREPFEHPLAMLDFLAHRALAVVAFEFLEVGAHGETRGFARMDHHGSGALDRDAFQHAVQFVQQRP